MDRREFLASIGAAGAMQAQSAQRLPIRKGILTSMLPKDMTWAERFQLAKEVGFQSLEGQTETDPATASAIKDASVKTGLPIHSVMNMDHWKYPLSSPDPAVVDVSLKGIETSLKNAKLWGADTVLVVPAVVTPAVSYRDAWTRSQVAIRRVLPMAQQMGIVLGIEEVWNKFLLSPLEMVKYVDEFNSPYIKMYFDVGNVVLYGYPQDWIRTLGPRICKLHLKDFSFRRDPQVGNNSVARWVNLGDGDIDWVAVYDALKEVGYKGDATVELSGGDAAYLKDLSGRVDRILDGQMKK